MELYLTALFYLPFPFPLVSLSDHVIHNTITYRFSESCSTRMEFRNLTVDMYKSIVTYFVTNEVNNAW